MSTATRVLAEIIASDVSLLIHINQAINAVIQNIQKAIRSFASHRASQPER